MSITQRLKRAMQINRRGTATLFGERRRTWEEFGGRVAKLAGARPAFPSGHTHHWRQNLVRPGAARLPLERSRGPAPGRSTSRRPREGRCR